jgi:hypothetical protein
MWITLSSSRNIRTCIRLFFPDINVPDRIPIDMEVLVGLAGRTSAFRNVLLIRLKDVEYGAKFAWIIEVTKIPKLNPATSTTWREERRRRKPERDRVRANNV